MSTSAKEKCAVPKGMIFELFCSEMGYIFKGTATQKCALHNKDISTSSDKSTGGYHTKAETGNGELI